MPRDLDVSQKIRIIHYVNQFFGGLGGEEHAGLEPQWFDGARGPGLLLEKLAPDIEVVGTIVAGDNYMAERLAEGTDRILSLIDRGMEEPGSEPILFFAGPAFNAGRYGMACCGLCKAVQDRLGIRALTATYPENPAVDNYRRDITILAVGENVLGMEEALRGMATLAPKLLRGKPVTPQEDGTIPHGIRLNYWAPKTGAERGIDMLMKKLSGADFTTEYRMPTFDRVEPAPAVKDLTRAIVALVTSGGIVPRGNPDHIEAASASKFGEYPLDGLDALSANTHQSVHGGYDPTYANADPNRVLPLDVARDLEREGRIGRLHDRYYTTVGNATSVGRAARFGKDIAALLVNEGVQAVVFTST